MVVEVSSTVGSKQRPPGSFLPDPRPIITVWHEGKYHTRQHLNVIVINISVDDIIVVMMER